MDEYLTKIYIINCLFGNNHLIILTPFALYLSLLIFILFEKFIDFNKQFSNSK